MRNTCSGLRLSARTVLLSGCFMGQPREFSFSEQGASQGHQQMGWEMAPSRGSYSLTARQGRFGCSDSTQRSLSLVLALWEIVSWPHGKIRAQGPSPAAARDRHQHPTHPAEQKLRPKAFRVFFLLLLLSSLLPVTNLPQTVWDRTASQSRGATQAAQPRVLLLDGICLVP